MRNVLVAGLWAAVLAGCQAGPAAQTIVPEETFGVITPALPAGYPPKMGDVSAVIGGQQTALATYDFSVGAMDGSASFRRSDVLNGVPVPQGQIDMVIVAYPDENPQARAGRVIIEAMFPNGPAAGALGQNVILTVQQEEAYDGKMLSSADTGGRLQLDQFSRSPGENYGQMRGTVSGTICEAIDDQVITNAECVPFSATFETKVQFDYSEDR